MVVKWPWVNKKEQREARQKQAEALWGLPI